MDWRLNLLRGTIYSVLPFSSTLRRFKRRAFPYKSESPNTRFAIADGLTLLDALARAGAPHAGTVLEMGTGWLPVIPILFRLAGYDRLILTDAEPLMDDQTIAIARESVRSRMSLIAEKLDPSADQIDAALRKPLPMAYHAPWNPADFKGDQVDAIISRCVFEHVRPDDLKQALTGFHHVLRPGGWMCHLVDNSDHWQHHNLKWSRIQFLTREGGSLMDRIADLDRHSYTNRLRHSDYVRLFRDTGWEVVSEQGEPDAKAMRDLGSLKLSRRFSAMDQRDLATLTSCFVLRKPS